MAYRIWTFRKAAGIDACYLVKSPAEASINQRAAESASAISCAEARVVSTLIGGRSAFFLSEAELQEDKRTAKINRVIVVSLMVIGIWDF